MKEFFVGLLVIVSVLVLAGLGVLLFPLLVVFGFAVKLLILILIGLLAVWAVGKLTLLIIDALKGKEQVK